MADLAVILPAAGSSSRFGANKLLAELGGEPVIARTVRAFRQRPDVKLMVVATRLDFSSDDAAPSAFKLSSIGEGEQSGMTQTLHVCPGGACRAESVLNALKSIPEAIEWVAVHDAARPLVSQALIARTFEAALEHGAAVPALPVALTVKRAAGPLPARVIETVPRNELWAMQTPQIMRRRDLLDAFARCPVPLEQVTDDVQLLELVGREVWLVEGEERNLKITTPQDLKVAEMLVSEV